MVCRKYSYEIVENVQQNLTKKRKKQNVIQTQWGKKKYIYILNEYAN